MGAKKLSNIGREVEKTGKQRTVETDEGLQTHSYDAFSNLEKGSR